MPTISTQRIDIHWFDGMINNPRATAEISTSFIVLPGIQDPLDTYQGRKQLTNINARVALSCPSHMHKKNPIAESGECPLLTAIKNGDQADLNILVTKDAQGDGWHWNTYPCKMMEFCGGCTAKAKIL